MIQSRTVFTIISNFTKNGWRHSSSKNIKIRNEFRFTMRDNDGNSGKPRPNESESVKETASFETFPSDDLLKVAEEHRSEAERFLKNDDKIIIRSKDKQGELKFLKRSFKSKYNNVVGEILYGVHPVLIALQQKRREFYKLYIKSSHTIDKNRSEIEKLGRELSIPLEYVDVQALETLCDKRLHQGICADVSQITPKLFEPNFASDQSAVWLLLFNVQDPMNMGALLRSSYFFGINRVLCTKNCCVLSPVVSKSSSGALELMEISIIDDFDPFIKDLKDKGWSVVGSFSNEHTESTNPPAINVNDYKLAKPAIILMGSEGEGLSLDVLNSCDVIVNISPGRDLNPAMNSLNVSAAASVILHKLLSNKSV